MTQRSDLVLAVLSLAACTPDRRTAQATTSYDPALIVMADTQTIDGVLHMRHGADAFARAPQFTIAERAEVVIDGGDDPDFDLTRVYRPALLSDGRIVASHSLGRGRVMLFKADGTPERILAPGGQGPGDVMSPLEPIILPNDVIAIVDGGHRRLSLFHADSGLQHGEMLDEGIHPFCFRPNGLVTHDRLLVMNGCSPNATADGAFRPATAVLTVSLRYGDVDTLLIAPGPDYVSVETRYRGRRSTAPEGVLFGRRTFVAPWDGAAAIAAADGGYVIDRRTLDGVLRGRLLVEVPAREVTSAMINDEITRALAGLKEGAERMVDAEESRRLVRERPVADSLPPYGELNPGRDGWLWVTDFTTWVDSVTMVTAFRADGAIMARLRIPQVARPVWFGEGRVMLREVDADGVVRFGIYRISRRDRGSEDPHEEGPASP